MMFHQYIQLSYHCKMTGHEDSPCGTLRLLKMLKSDKMSCEESKLFFKSLVKNLAITSWNELRYQWPLLHVHVGLVVDQTDLVHVPNLLLATIYHPVNVGWTPQDQKLIRSSFSD